MIEDLWYKNAVIYSLDVDTFIDGTATGWGTIGGNHFNHTPRKKTSN
jgi:maltose alpha-D-glucosyltransferase/alpha-amylase